MNFYNISKGQLGTLWALAIVISFVGGSASEYGSDAYGFIATIFFFAVIFYTFGWFNNRRQKNRV